MHFDSTPDSESDNNADDDTISSSSSSKRRRFSGHFEGDSEDDAEASTPPETSPQSHTDIPMRRTRVTDTSTTAGRGMVDRETCDYDDWLDLKDLFARATEQYESDDSTEALPLIRGVIHECHRFLLYYHDPSVLFAAPPRTKSRSPELLTPPDERLARDWGTKIPRKSSPEKPQRPKELPTAFHSILGSSLFMFGNLIAQDSSLILPGESQDSCSYWLAALDVFETGENLPGRLSGQYIDSSEDWRMAIVWGRTLVCLADEILTRSSKTKPDSSPVDEHKWSPQSPFSTIASRRPPVTRRMSLTSVTANELMVLAMDQFSRGIFHMPHPQYHAPDLSDPSASPQFSRAKELFTLASEVLGVAERLESASERQYWASWADSVFNQMKMEADMDVWRGPITRARGRCWLVVGSARVDELEGALENGDDDILSSEMAEEAREGLTTAITYFERAKGSSSSDPDSAELPPLLTEALLTLANLTPDENKREELYSRAQLEGQFDLTDTERMDESA